MFAMPTKGMLVAIALLVAACGPEDLAPEPDAMELEPDASLDDALVEGKWMIHVHVTGCQATEWDVPTFDIEVEGDGDVVATCPECTSIEVDVFNRESMHVDLTRQIGGADNPDWKAIASIDAGDDGVTAAASVQLAFATTTCETFDAAATVTRVRE